MRTEHLLGSLVVATVLIVGGCAPREPNPTHTILAMHRALSAGDVASASALVDYRYRLGEVLGAMFDSAPEADRAAAVELAKQMFAKTTESLWKTHYDGRPTTTRIVKREGPHVWVEGLADGDGHPSFTWTYRLTWLDGRWRVTQREYRSGPLRSDTTAFYPMAVRQLIKQLGRTPTLGELNANLPSLQGRLRARTYHIPELPARPGKP